MAKPTAKKINAWIDYRFPGERDGAYRNQWKNRFASPRRVWGYSDIQSRKALQKFFKSTFGKLKIGDNLYNSEWGDEFKKWQ